MDSPRILIQLDSDPRASVFDAVVALDAQVGQLLQYDNIEATNVLPLVHGAMFTRGPAELKHTAIFVGGSNVAMGDAIGEVIRQSFFGPIRVSVMLDGNGANTTASAAVLCAARHMDLNGAKALVLGGTGPVGQRVARLMLRQGATVQLVSRDSAKAESACRHLRSRMAAENLSRLSALATADDEAFRNAIAQATVILCCGAAGVTVLTDEQMRLATSAQVAIDLNAVPPCGLTGIDVMDKAVTRAGRFDYGAIGVGGLKMKIHRAAIQALFTQNDLFLDAEEIFEIGQQLETKKLR